MTGGTKAMHSDHIMVLIFFSVLWFGFLGGLFVASIAREKGRSGLSWFFISLLFSPFMALLGLIAVPNSQLKQRNQRPTRRKYDTQADHSTVSPGRQQACTRGAGANA